MNNPAYNIAQINIARLNLPIDDPQNRDFVSNLDRINSLAETYPGFVWRLKDESGNATAIQVFDDPLMIVNMSIWESIDMLFAYTYRSEHVDIFRRQAEWFATLKTPHLALWWIPHNHIPMPSEGKEKLEYLSDYGATPYAFTFKKQFSSEDMLTYFSIFNQP